MTSETTRKTRSSRSKTSNKTSVSKAKSQAKKNLKRAREEKEEEETEAENPEGEDPDAYDDHADEEEEDDDDESLDSDALDEEDDVRVTAKRGKKRSNAKTGPSNSKPSSTRKPTSTAKGSLPAKKKRKTNSKAKGKQSENEDDDEDILELEEGQEIVGAVIQAPKTGRVPPGQISKNTFDFLSQLKKPECNDRQWFKLHEAVYRLAEKEWKDFVEEFTDSLVEVDPQIPHLPPKDVIHRIYRDVRFSNDKTPYKKGFSASFSRSGRKGIFAGYHVAVRPGGESLIAAGSWQPGKNELSTIRNNIQRSSTRLRKTISAPQFVKFFGEPKPHPKGHRQNIFGMEDELKVAPKGIEKTHKDIDLLKCRSFAVVHSFTDKQVLSPDFKTELAKVAKIMRPFVHCINDMMTIQDATGDSEDEDEDNSGEDDQEEIGESPDSREAGQDGEDDEEDGEET
ncbi:Conserved hypothetical protein CHP02453 [Abortiporus biennis]